MQKKYGFLLGALLMGFILVGLLVYFNNIFYDSYKLDKVGSSLVSNGEEDIFREVDVNLMEEKKVFSEVWSQHSPYGKSYEFKVNCVGEFKILEECFLWDIEKVIVNSPDGKEYLLNKDFNVNNYSGEITRRWVLYGPYNSSLPQTGKYNFKFIKNGEVILIDSVYYIQNNIGYPSEVKWKRDNNEIFVSWKPPKNFLEEGFYKVIIWNEFDTSSLFISQRFDGNIVNASLKDVPLQNNGNYSLNVAVYFKDGYAFSKYNIFSW